MLSLSLVMVCKRRQLDRLALTFGHRPSRARERSPLSEFSCPYVLLAEFGAWRKTNSTSLGT